jgi:hypothetical protein
MNKNSYPKRARLRNSHSQPDLFDDWMRDKDFRVANPEARRLAARHGLSIRHAAVLMELHGLGAR